MPKKKTLEIPVDSAIPPSPLAAAPISCPACKSKISADGKTLHEKSSNLEELIEVDAEIDKIEKILEEQKKTIAGHVATIAFLKSQLEAENKKPTQEKEIPNVGTQGTKKRGGGWVSWD